MMLATVGPTPLISVVAPCYNEEDGLQEFVRRTVAACRAMAGDRFELVLINDGSADRTWTCIRALSRVHPQIVGLDLTRNHGHQLAVTAGLAVARGERVLIIDADLQDPPELLGDMMARMDEGYDVVFGRRRARAAESWIKKATAHAFYRLLNRLSEVEIPRDTGDFRLLSRGIVDLLNAMPEQDRFLRGMVAWLGGSQTEVLYDRDPRYAGKSGYTMRKMIRLAAAGVTSFSTVPLKIAGLLAGVGMLAAVGIGVYVLTGFLTGRVVPGWTSLALILTFFGAVQLACLSVLGSYIGRIFLQVKGRPLFLVREVIGREGTSARSVSAAALLGHAATR